MSTVKISELPLSNLNSSSNTSNIFFVIVDSETNFTNKVSETQLSKNLFNNNVLNVGGSPLNFSNVSAQITGNSSPFLQINTQNFNSSSSVDYVGTADIGTNSYNYIDLGINNSTFSDQNFSSMGALDGYLYVQGSSSNTSGNLVIGTATSSANIVFIAGGTTSSNVVSRFNRSKIDFLTSTAINANSSSSAFTINQLGSGAAFVVNDQYGNDPSPFIIDSVGNVGIATNNTSNYKLNVLGDSQFTGNVVFSDSSIQSTAAAPANVTISAFDRANTAIENTNAANNYLQANINSYMASAKSYTDNSNTYNYLANNQNTVTIAGNVISKSITSNGFINVIANSSLPNIASVRITGSANGVTQAPLNSGYMLQVTGYANTSTRIVADSFGANTYSAFIGRSARGSANTPLSTANNDILLRISGNGWSNNFSQFGTGRIDFVAGENYTDSAKGSRIEFWNIANGTVTENKIASFNADSVTFSGVVNAQKGFIYNPRIISTAQTAITIDFSTDSTIYVPYNTSLTVSMVNYYPGKVVEVWAKNTAAAGNQTITHGLSANNTTIAASNFASVHQSITFMKYFCVADDIANTFATITHP